MKVFIKDLIDGALNKNFGANATAEYLIDGLPMKNFEISWEKEDPKSNYMHFLFIDYDAIPVCGKPWIHWTVANINLNKYKKLAENCTWDDHELIQGITSLAFENGIKEPETKKNKYIGPMPPDKTHWYTLLVWTTEHPVEIKNGFYFNELYKQLNQLEIVENEKLDFKYIK